MRELGYVPNQLAGALASARTRSVGVLVPTIANSIFADTVQGLSDELEPLGYAVILAQSRYDAAREDHMLSALLSRRPEAIIMVGSPATEDGARLLRRAGIPVVETWDLPAAPIDAVAGFDNYAGRRRGRAASRGAGPPEPRLHRRRRSARDAALERFQGHRAAGRRQSAAPADSGAQRVGQRGRAGAICPASMRYSPPMMRMPSASCPACARAGLLRNGPASEQPVAVIGLGDLEMGRLIAPSLSTIRVHGDAIGRTAAKLMLTRDGPRHVDLGFELVLRDSG